MSDNDAAVSLELVLWQDIPKQLARFVQSTLSIADDPGSPPLPGRKVTEDDDDDDLSIMSEELEEDPEAEPADGEGDDDDEDGQRWACYSDAAGSLLYILDKLRCRAKG